MASLHSPNEAIHSTSQCVTDMPRQWSCQLYLKKKLNREYFNVVRTWKFINYITAKKPKYFSKFSLEDVTVALRIPEFRAEFRKNVVSNMYYATKNVAIAFRRLSKTNKEFIRYRSQIACQALSNSLPEEIDLIITHFWKNIFFNYLCSSNSNMYIKNTSVIESKQFRSETDIKCYKVVNATANIKSFLSLQKLLSICW